MKLTLECPYASYGPDMKIKCAKADGLCGNQRYRPCKGWNVLTEWAKNCPLRSETKTTTKRRAKK